MCFETMNLNKASAGKLTRSLDLVSQPCFMQGKLLAGSRVNFKECVAVQIVNPFPS